MNQKNLSIKIHIGTSGWSYKHWAGIFYPADVKPARWLEFYAERFHCVELNTSFYHLPRKSTVKGWYNRTTPDFIFCPKLSRYITHQQKLLNSEEALGRFFDVFTDLKPRMGPVLIQLPPGLRYDEKRVSDFFGQLCKNYPGYRFAVEVRHASWLTEPFFRTLEESKIAFVIADSGKRFPYYEAVTTDFVYLRLHGHETLYASDYPRDSLHEYAGKIESWLDHEKEVWVFFNNDFHGYAVSNALTLSGMLDVTISEIQHSPAKKM